MSETPKQPVVFTSKHNDAYEELRKLLQHMHMAGIPGMDKILNVLHTTHTNLIKPVADEYNQSMPGGQSSPSSDYNQ